jgi:peroxiredoxin
MRSSTRIEPGTLAGPRELTTIHCGQLRIPDSRGLVHLQFRRFAGCPVCDLHLHSVVQRHNELVAASVREVIVFHSTADDLLRFAESLPFAVVADPEKRLYREFGVEHGIISLANPRAWIPILRGVLRSFGSILHNRRRIPSMNPAGGRFGLPADFLIAPSGQVLACKYGSHAYDQWSVDEVLGLARLKAAVL